MGRIDAVTSHISEQEIREGAAGIRAVETKASARSASLPKRNAAAVDFAVELEKVPPFLPGKHIRERSDRIRAYARADLPLKIVHVVHAVRAVQRDRRRTIFLRKPRHERQTHFADDVECGVIGGAENFRLVEAMPSAAEFVDDGGPDNARPRDGHVLRPADIIPLVMPPNGRARLIGVVEHVAAR